MYPYPTNVDKFESEYVNDHVPLAKEKIKGMSKFIATRVVGTPTGDTPGFYRIAELHFPSMDLLKEALTSPGGQEAAGHAISISSGGIPVFLIAEEETIEF
jgi:uncharacterized protein (TIGR02118 family)